METSRASTSQPPAQHMEDITTELESIHKSLKLIQIENVIFSSFLKKFCKIAPCEIEGPGVKELSVYEKYSIALLEEKFLQQYLFEGKKNPNAILKSLKMDLEVAETAITELKNEATNFQKVILEPKQRGELDYVIVKEYDEIRLKEKKRQAGKLESKILSTQEKIAKIKQTIIKKNQNSNDVNFIDFHQLQIENRKFQKDVLEKNLKLINLKAIVI